MRMLAYRVSGDSIDELLAEGKQRGFPGMLGSLDCMHWKWKNCPVAWKGMYVGHAQELTIILEAMASYDLWIWHMFFGLPGSHNDINVLDRSPLFKDLAEGRVPSVNYSINGHNYTMGKDVERAFRVLQAPFAIVRGPARFWDRDTLDDIMKACVIMHNMIVEDEHITKDIEDLNDDNAILDQIHISGKTVSDNNANNDTMEQGCSSQKPVQKLGFL
ncbi:hypothetical protein WN944_009513 [Citrus x changshan-huyou]|uniref:Nuclease HARBI1 n=1 Tax=Citrus x changshan-huyou TaxID=2935761 RepID=A0AAP0MUN4_9ROSI